MKIDVHAEQASASQVNEMKSTVRAALREMAQRIVRVVVRAVCDAEKRHAAHSCMIEVHMADGHVEFVEERQRRFGAALRRAARRAWTAASRWVARQLPPPPGLSLQPLSVRTEVRPLATRPGSRSWERGV